MCQSNRLVGLVNSEIGMQKNSTRQTKRHTVYNDKGANPGVWRLQVFVAIVFFVAIYTVNTGKGYDNGSPAQDPVQLVRGK